MAEAANCARFVSSRLDLTSQVGYQQLLRKMHDFCLVSLIYFLYHTVPAINSQYRGIGVGNGRRDGHLITHSLVTGHHTSIK